METDLVRHAWLVTRNGRGAVAGMRYGRAVLKFEKLVVHFATLHHLSSGCHELPELEAMARPKQEVRPLGVEARSRQTSVEVAALRAVGSPKCACHRLGKMSELPTK